jgi:hypothetical protein
MINGEKTSNFYFIYTLIQIRVAGDVYDFWNFE